MIPEMFQRRHALGVLLAIGIVLLGFSLSVDYPRQAGAMWSDEATYYTMAHSLAYDGDLRFTRKDLERVYREFREGPSGIFLKRGREGSLTFGSPFPLIIRDGEVTEEIYFAKSFLYSLGGGAVGAALRHPRHARPPHARGDGGPDLRILLP